MVDPSVSSHLRTEWKQEMPRDICSFSNAVFNGGERIHHEMYNVPVVMSSLNQPMAEYIYIYIYTDTHTHTTIKRMVPFYQSCKKVFSISFRQ